MPGETYYAVVVYRILSQTFRKKVTFRVAGNLIVAASKTWNNSVRGGNLLSKVIEKGGFSDGALQKNRFEKIFNYDPED